MNPIQTITVLNRNLPAHLSELLKNSPLAVTNKPSFWQLQMIDCSLQLVAPDDLKFSPLLVDFVGGAVGHRRKFGGGKGQDIAKAVGLNKKDKLHIADFTAGLGRDAFVFANLHCKVSLFERNPVVQLLLADGLYRAQFHDETAEIAKLMQLQCGDSLVQQPNEQFDVVYLDPMFPMRKKSALVKKEMQMFHHIVGDDNDADGLFDLAWQAATYRVVVKRPKGAPPLANKQPTIEFSGKTGRFDVYVKHGFKE